MQAELQAEKSAHANAKRQLERHAGEMASKSLEFGEKEYYQVTVGHLEELQRAKDAEIDEAREAHEKQVQDLAKQLAEVHAAQHVAERRAPQEVGGKKAF